MLKKTLVLLTVVVLLAGLMVFPASAAEEYTVSGVWVLNDTLNGNGNLSQDVNFTVDGSSSSYISIVFENSSGRLYYYYGVGKDWHMPYYSGWISNYKDNGDNWKTIDFGSTSQVVSDTFYSWLTANAIQIEDNFRINIYDNTGEHLIGSFPAYGVCEIWVYDIGLQVVYPDKTYDNYYHNDNDTNTMLGLALEPNATQPVYAAGDVFTVDKNTNVKYYIVPVSDTGGSGDSDSSGGAGDSGSTDSDDTEGSPDDEKAEIENAGDGAAGELMDIIPNESQGFMDAVKSLVGAMSYSGTNASLPIPPIKIPAINGVMDEIKLTDELSVDFGYWVGKLPADILNLVQILCTIALIVYCFKELYSTIAYAMTLKGGGSGE